MARVWSDPDAYERSMARWSRILNRVFVPWLAVPKEASWLDVGCGTGALSQTLFEIGRPGSVTGIDPSEKFIAAARGRVPGASFEVAPAERLPFADGSFDAAAASLCFHVMPDPAGAAAEMLRVLRPGGVAGATVWPATRGMDAVNRMWDVAREAGLPPRPSVARMAEAKSLGHVFDEAGFEEVTVTELVIPTIFESFADLWEPFAAGPGAGGAQSYVAALTENDREKLRAGLERTVPVEPDGSIHLKARAFAARARKPEGG